MSYSTQYNVSENTQRLSGSNDLYNEPLDWEFLSFILDGNEFGIDILKVQEIRGWSPLRELPNLPAFVQGVIDLRGKVIPVVDMRTRMGLKKADYSNTTVVIIIQQQMAGFTNSIYSGLIVDAVADVYRVTKDNYRSIDNLTCYQQNDFISGMVSVDKNIIVLIDFAKILSN
ncbi:purine-binding chemotaxis protein CheW [Endozoicomonas sp. SM1973]|uniref:Chemotaxis protein CheW n=1 Tax=Spartinivicinus marinus TaxID=2994442 RepID=A0A853I5N3_9GAMM|nr:chemotaxis protein CheW [Spartinivicinus marinus]MCX4025267.1 chemotaxis protein CheW [Spartinivicinus marinus]NYZ65988.1 purine-binding chemotaxis protein CheW [Spartinivicinus marinus]